MALPTWARSSSRVCRLCQRPTSSSVKAYCSNATNDPPVTDSLVKNYPKRIFSGIQPTGQIHVGNYFGAIKNWVKYQDEKVKGLFDESIYCVVDLHAITLPQDPDKLRKMILEAVATIVACGIDPEKSILFLQSHVPIHTQLSWVMSCSATMPQLNRLASFKEKSKKLKEVPIGLFTYPVLQAADILAYNATHVPVGDDNIPHIQIAYHLAKKFNQIYGETFALPEAVSLGGLSARIRSLRKPENKMSKSEADPRSRICLQDSPDEIFEKIKKSVTDFTSEVTYEPEARLGVSNLVEIHSLCTNKTTDEIVKSVQHLDTGKYKLEVAEALIEHLKPIRKTMLELMNDEHRVLDILRLGKEKAEELASIQWDLVCRNIGISPSLTSVELGKKNVVKL